jgi:hypothetical protein
MEAHLQIVFSFIVTMMETAIKSTPNASPTKPAQLQEKEIDHFEDEVWSKVYELMDRSIVSTSPNSHLDPISSSYLIC